jgi:hypothetical protein
MWRKSSIFGYLLKPVVAVLVVKTFFLFRFRCENYIDMIV